jgi:hypothetical protein
MGKMKPELREYIKHKCSPCFCGSAVQIREIYDPTRETKEFVLHCPCGHVQTINHTDYISAIEEWNDKIIILEETLGDND